MCIKKLWVFLFCNLVILAVSGQTGTARLTLSNEGSTLFFTFNSFDKYQNGISLTTIGSVYYIDTICNPLPCVTTGTEWELVVVARTPAIVGDNGNNLPLGSIFIEITGTDAAATYNNRFLQFVERTLVTNGSQSLPIPGSFTTLFITYNIGTFPANRLLGEVPDDYYVDIIFTLQKE
jgi:hypothetical protein